MRREHRACDEQLKMANTSVMTSERAKASLRADHEACHQQHESLTAQLKAAREQVERAQAEAAREQAEAAREQASSSALVSALEMRLHESHSALYEQLTAANDQLRVAEVKLTATEGALAATKATLTATVEKLSAADSKLKETEAKLEVVQSGLAASEARASCEERPVKSDLEATCEERPVKSDLAASEARASAEAARASTAEAKLNAAETTVMALEGRSSAAEAKHVAAERQFEPSLAFTLALLESTPPPLLFGVVGVLICLCSALALGGMLCMRRSPHAATDAELHTVRHGQWRLGGYGRDAAATAWAVWVHAAARRMAHAHRMRSGRRFMELRRLSIAFAAWELVLGAAADDNDEAQPPLPVVARARAGGRALLESPQLALLELRRSLWESSQLRRSWRCWHSWWKRIVAYLDTISMQFTHVVVQKIDAPGSHSMLERRGERRRSLRGLRNVWQCDPRERLAWALLHASQQGRLETVKELVERGAPVGVTDPARQNALHAACLEGHPEVVRMLCRAEGTDLEAKDTNGCTAFMLASLRGHEEVMEVLSQAGAKSY
jgi:chemotaxis protein histidine kinase CheA